MVEGVSAVRLRRLETMLLIRRFEERLIRLHQLQAFRGHYHVSIGQESGAVAACEPLTRADYLFTTHRNHAHLLARGADPARIFAEILGRADGYNGGRGGTLHVVAPDLNVPVTSALVGGSLPIATGAALGLERRGGNDVVLALFGDAALEEGAFYESVNLAVLWHLPIVYVCDNNSIAHEKRKPGQYPSSRLSNDDLTAAPAAFGIPSVSIGGADVNALADLVAGLVSDVRAGGGPRFVEVQFERWPGNYDLWPAMVGRETELGWAWGESPPDEVAEWCRHADPILLEVTALVDEGAASADDLLALDAVAQARIDDAAERALASPFPAPESAHHHVLASRSAR
jgi:TPP-dependent pyruvate/acetoin dehydrogenase alpha subunit